MVAIFEVYPFINALFYVIVHALKFAYKQILICDYINVTFEASTN